MYPPGTPRKGAASYPGQAEAHLEGFDLEFAYRESRFGGASVDERATSTSSRRGVRQSTRFTAITQSHRSNPLVGNWESGFAEGGCGVVVGSVEPGICSQSFVLLRGSGAFWPA